MLTLSEPFVVDKNGRRVAVMLDINEYDRLIEAVEELECLRAYDAAKASEIIALCMK